MLAADQRVGDRQVGLVAASKDYGKRDAQPSLVRFATDNNQCRLHDAFRGYRAKWGVAAASHRRESNP